MELRSASDLSLLAVLLALFSLAHTVNGDKKDCLIDKETGWHVPSNVYQCDNSDCCREYGKHSCCAKKKTSDIVQEQLLLWGGLLGFLVILAALIYCKRKDIRIFEGRTLRCKCCPGQRDRIENMETNVA
ncbi:uncharacterized protein LOC135397515 [Ornithodoros turicata]|uniref:uncharacterized protein LOC135397515 n=1 Tax=Ornithodoros turicata TaxID=34597 RepID=UPI003139EB83